MFKGLKKIELKIRKVLEVLKSLKIFDTLWSKNSQDLVYVEGLKV